MKERQGAIHQETISTLMRTDGSTATSSSEKAELSDLFASKLTVSDLRKAQLKLEPECDQLVTTAEARCLR